MKFEEFEYEVKYGLAKITSFIGDSWKVYIPSKIDKYNVYTICSGAFSNLNNLKEVVIPKSVGKLEDEAFINCPNLEKISLNTIEEINNPFKNCSKNLRITTYQLKMASTLEDLNLDASIICNKDFKIEITDEENKECILQKTNIRSNFLYIPDKIDGYKVTEFGFILSEDKKSENLKRVRLPKYLEKIPDNFFSGLHIESVEIGDNLKEIGRASFCDCEDLKTLKLPSSLKKIGERAFMFSLIESIDIPDSVEETEGGIFEHCTNLKNVKLSRGLSKIEDYTFNGCICLEKIDIPENIKKIGTSTFRDCHELKEIIIPDKVTYISDYVFSGCLNLKKINIPESVKVLGDFCFAYCQKIETINMHEGIHTIGHGAMSDCFHLEEITIPKSAVKIKNYIFENCDNLRKIYYKGNLKDVIWGSKNAKTITEY